MEKRIIYENAEGGVTIIIPALDSNLTLEQIIAKDVPPNVSFEIVDVSSIPTDRTFRDAWEKHDKVVNVNMQKARNIKRSMIRREREAELAKLDIQFMKAIETGNNEEQTRISVEKQKYRDAPANLKIEQANIPEELKDLTLNDLL